MRAQPYSASPLPIHMSLICIEAVLFNADDPGQLGGHRWEERLAGLKGAERTVF